MLSSVNCQLDITQDHQKMSLWAYIWEIFILIILIHTEISILLVAMNDL